MTDVVRQVITPIANQEDAIALGVIDGFRSFNFDAYLTTDPSGNGDPTHCWGSGFINPIAAEAYENGGSLYFVTSFGVRQARQAPPLHNPPLYIWNGPPMP